MFTGIVEEVGSILEAKEGFLRISVSKILADTKLGDSIAINGVDLTVSDMAGDALSFHLMPETYRRSNLADLRPGDAVNLERAVRPSDRLSGHIVRGVVEATGTLESSRAEADAVILTYRAPADLLQYVIVKGPICIDGASLTVIAKTAETFSVSLVEYTQQNTNHLQRRPGDSVNLESDILARYVAQILEARGVIPSQG